MKIRFAETTIIGLYWYPKDEKQSTWVLHVQSKLTPALAEKLQCRDLCFGKKDIARQFEGRLGISGYINGGAIDLDEKVLDIEKAWKFKVGRRNDAADHDISLYVMFRVHINGDEPYVYAFAKRQNQTAFGCSIEPAQGTLSFMNDETEEEPEAKEEEKSA